MPPTPFGHFGHNTAKYLNTERPFWSSPWYQDQRNTAQPVVHQAAVSNLVNVLCSNLPEALCYSVLQEAGRGEGRVELSEWWGRRAIQ